VATGHRRGKVILYLPRHVPPEYENAVALAVPPLPHLALGGPLRQAGYDVRIIDAKWEPRAREEIEATLGEAVCLGISALTGHAISDGLAMAGLAKTLRPEVPVIWGGWHPTFAARQAAADPRVDVVVRGQGEHTIVELLDALEQRRPWTEIPGLTYRDGTAIVDTPDRAGDDLNAFPPPAYDLIDAQRYIQTGPDGSRNAATIFSRGCPYQCDFCLDSRQRWRGLSMDRVRQDLEFWVLQQGANNIRFYDGNFFLGRPRLVEFSRMVLDSGLAGRFQWTATGVGTRLTRLDGDTLTLLHRAGCRQVAIGAESGSDELLQQITNKTTVEHTTEAVRLLTRHGIGQYLFFMVGFPEEPEDALEQTFRLIYRLGEINPDIEIQMNFCVPLPGSEMFRIALERGLFEDPRTFADWAQIEYLRPSLPHISREYQERVGRFVSFMKLRQPVRSLMMARLIDQVAAR
jgi:anaerobic magnesium-protoporphyrin IX monomethyl ester cyclase